MKGAQESGYVLTLTDGDVDQVAVRIASLWENYNTERRAAMALNEEVRQYVYGTDIDQTSAMVLPHKNRTHQPKLTSLADTLQTQYFEASLSMPEFFRFEGQTPEDREKAMKIEAWLRVKLEQKHFRETVGRQLIADFVQYGNCFGKVTYVEEKDETGKVIYRGPMLCRVPPTDIVFNPREEAFQKSIKIERRLIHVAKLAKLTENYPTGNFIESAIKKAIEVRHSDVTSDWAELVKERGITMDGYGSWDEYFKQDLVELLVYYGDVFDPETLEVQQNRIVYVVDKTFVIRNEPNRAPIGYDGLHHAGWRPRTNNLWAQGPLDNLVGMQYRIDHLENLKADVFDLIAHPVIKILGDEVSEPEQGYAPGAVYYCGAEGDVQMLVPDTTALQADNQIQYYHRLMEEFAGAPPESRGIRTPGEKTAFEVSKLDANATMMFVDKARIIERMLEEMLKEAFELMLLFYDENDYINIFNDVKGAEELRQLALEDVTARGEFVAVGARHWMRRNRQALEMQQFQTTVTMDPKVAAHISGIKLAEYYRRTLNIEAEGIVEPYVGIKEQAHAAAVFQSYTQQLEQQTEQTLQPEAGGAEPMEQGGTPPKIGP